MNGLVLKIQSYERFGWFRETQAVLSDQIITTYHERCFDEMIRSSDKVTAKTQRALEPDRCRIPKWH
jgi:hypothetical protein